MSARVRACLLTWIAAGAGALAMAAAPAALAAPAPHWKLAEHSVPTSLTPGGAAKVVVDATNLGDAATNGAFTLAVKLPEDLSATGVEAEVPNTSEVLACKPIFFPPGAVRELSCAGTKPLPPEETIKITVRVAVGASPGTFGTQLSASGGGAPTATDSAPVTVSSEPAAFGFEHYELRPEEENGETDLQAGSHPFQLTTTIALNDTATEEPVSLTKNLTFGLPAGLVGNPRAVQACTQTQFEARTGEKGVFERNFCPAETAVGIATVAVDEPFTFSRGPGVLTVPVFNLEPTKGSEGSAARGEPARLGFLADKVPVILDTSIESGKTYRVKVSTTNTSQTAGLLWSTVTIWGDPGSAVHNISRGWECAGVGAEGCPRLLERLHNHPLEEKPFLTLPTSCETPLSAPMSGVSWVPGATPVEKGNPDNIAEIEQLKGCESLKLEPTLQVTPTTAAGATNTGLNVNIEVPQPEQAGTLGESAIRSTTVTLPPGVLLNPAAATGLKACSALQMGFEESPGEGESGQFGNDRFRESFGFNEETHEPITTLCANESKVGTVKIYSPDLEHPLEGDVYLGQEGTNPFEPPFALYIVARDPVSGVVAKLAGKVMPLSDGQVVSTFENTPQVPFSKFELKFFEGQRASLSTPPECGSYTTTASFVPWSAPLAPVGASSSFEIKEHCSPGTPPFAPGLNAGSSTTKAGAFTNFSLTVNRPDGQQALNSLSVHLPLGMAAMLSSVTPCPIAQARNAQCPASSQIGTSTSVSGFGNEPFSLGGSVYLTQGFDGAPFGISDSTKAEAGPFNLGYVVVNSTLTVDKENASATVTAAESLDVDNHGSHVIPGSPIPTLIKGVPVQLKAINVTVNRPNFQFNPTNCSTTQNIKATLGGDGGTVATPENGFGVTGCGSLPFNPGLTAEAGGKYSRVNGTSFVVKVTSSPGQANIAKTKLVIPEQLPSRQTTLEKACLAATFQKNPALCSPESIIGEGVAHTPVLKNPLRGPAYLVSYGAAKFPDVEFVLQGEGIVLYLDGQTNIHNGVTTSSFNSVPDAPVSVFEAIFPTGPKSILTGYSPAGESICSDKLSIPTTLTGQNGMVIERPTPVTLTGCKGVAGVTVESPLAKALKACKKKYKHNKKKRQRCEAAARKKYAKKASHKHAKRASAKK